MLLRSASETSSPPEGAGSSSAADRITDAKFLTFGCAAAIATSSMATELIKGKTLDEALEVTNKTVAEALDGLPPVKMHCSVLAEQALRAAINDYRRRKGLVSEDKAPNRIEVPNCRQEG